jgi:lipoprotein NlpI
VFWLGDDLIIISKSCLRFYRHGQFEAVLEILQPDAPGQHDADYIRGYFLAELPRGPELALKEFYRLWQRRPSAWDTLAIQTTLRLLGRKEEAMDVCRKARERPSYFFMPWRQEWYQRLLDYNCGDLTEGDLMKTAEGSRYNQSEAHFFIALTRLAERDRSGAREHFRASVTNRVFHYLDYDWSKAFLARMEGDPNWPRIPVNTQR